MAVTLVYQSKFDRTAPRPTIGLLEFHTRFDGDRGRVLEFISHQDEISVSLEIFSKGTVDSDSDVDLSEISDHQKFIDWLNVHARGAVKIISNKFPNKFPLSQQTIPQGIWCLTGNFKTTRLRKVKKNFPTANFREISAHTLIRGELGETQRRLAHFFSGSSEKKFPIVLWDDIDLTLNTEGRIVKEIISDLLRFLENFQGLFVFTCDSRDRVLQSLAARVTLWNPEIENSF